MEMSEKHWRLPSGLNKLKISGDIAQFVVILRKLAAVRRNNGPLLFAEIWSFQMSSVTWVRGMNCVTFKCAASVALSVALASMTYAADAAKPSAELGTYSREGGKTYYALSLTPP